jgi:3'-phosphoadenosine 5'-phosphosulfate sulfotransferase (PAPS reductase)/FAD synthetase
MKRFISFSGGVESTTMCILYGKGAKAIWCDTGAEHTKMYDRINLVEERLKALHGDDFEIIKIKPSVKIKGEIIDNLLDGVIKNKFMPSQNRRYCTNAYKIQPIDKYLSEQGECELMIGLNADETNRQGNYGLKSNVTYLYPLQEDGYNRKDCEAILDMHKLHPNFPAYMLRGGCSMCFFKTEKEYKALWYLDRDEFDKMVAFEIRYQDNRKKFYSIMSNGKSLTQLAIECSNELFQDELKEIYENYNKSQKSCGAFCHR